MKIYKNTMSILFLFLLLHPPLQAQLVNKKIIDLTYPFDSLTVYWPTEAGFKLKIGFKGTTEKGYHYEANSFCAAEHGGTHIDAPAHFYANRPTVDEIPLENLIGDAVVIDVSEKCQKNRDYLISIKDMTSWEAHYGTIKPGSILLLKTGFGNYWPDRERYMGTNERGAEGVKKLHFPGLDPQAAKWLIQNRKIKAVGIDTPSIDYGQSTLFETHIVLTENKVPIFENVANMDQLPSEGFTVIALPMKIKGGSGAPLRIIALL